MKFTLGAKMLAGLALCLLSACWEATEVDVFRVVPGVISLPEARTVAVSEITGPQGDRVGHMLAENLMELQRFNVLDWSSPLGLGGRRSGGWAEARGDWQTADAAFLGSMQAPVLTPSYSMQSALSADGKEVTTYGRTLQMAVTGYFRVLDPHDGLILNASTVTVTSQAPPDYITLAEPDTIADGSQLEQYFPAAPQELLHELALAAMVDELTALVGVTYEATHLMLYHDRRNADLERALEQTKQGRWHDAVELYRTAVLEMEEHVPSQAYMAHYNYGVALACSGSLARGLEEVRVAHAMHKDRRIGQTIGQLHAYLEASLALQAKAQVRQ